MQQHFLREALQSGFLKNAHLFCANGQHGKLGVHQNPGFGRDVPRELGA
jgi:hypothetical protein